MNWGPGDAFFLLANNSACAAVVCNSAFRLGVGSLGDLDLTIPLSAVILKLLITVYIHVLNTDQIV